jgi:hypothetical protein
MADMNENHPDPVSPPRRDIARGGRSPRGGVAFKLYLETGRASVADIRAVLTALNELDLAAGGLGFTFELHDDDKSTTHADLPVAFNG